MVTAELGACEWFIWDLRRSNLVERGQLEQIVNEFLEQHPRAEPPELAAHLVELKILTPFQAESLLSGKSQILVLGPYIVTDVLGTGSMGTVYKTQNKLNNQWYAVKVLPRRSMWNIRIARRKVRDFEAFQHPAVVPFVDVGTTGGLHYLAWPLVQGESVEKLIQTRGKLLPAEAALYAVHTAEGLEACHVRGIIHGVLKTTDLVLAADKQIKILDFGVGALLMETGGESVVDTMSTANTLSNGLDYASPESIMDPTTMSPASDQYSLGCILYFLLTGRVPFPVESAVEKMMAHQTYMPTPAHELVPEVPAELSHVLERMMQKKPTARFASLSEVIVALRRFARESAAVPAPAPAPRPTPEPPRPASKAPAPEPMPSTNPRSLRHAMGMGQANGAAAHPASAPAPRSEPTALPPTPMPPTSMPPRTPNPPLVLPDRRSLHGLPPASDRGASLPAAAPVRPHAAPVPAAYQPPRESLEERIGPAGVAILAVLICAAAWAAAWYLW